MRIRAQLILAFVLLAVVPLTGIVLYSYFSSLRAVRQAVEEEAEAVTAEMDDRMTAIKQALRSRFRSLGQLPFGDLLGQPSEAAKEEFLERALSRMGASAGLIESFEIETVREPSAFPAPLPPGPHRPPPLPDDAPAPAAPVAPVEKLETIVLRVTEDLRGRYREIQREVEESDFETSDGIRHSLEVAALLADAFARGIEDFEDPELDGEDLEEISTLEQKIEKRARRVGRRREHRQAMPEHRMQVERQGGTLQLGGRFDVRQGSRLVRIQPKISSVKLLSQMLRLTRRDQGEIPFAVDGEGNLYVADEADREILEPLPLDRSGISDDWVITSSTDPETGLEFGIVRPLREPLAEVRQAAARNFGYGLGLILLALVGILPLSERMTRNLNVLTAGAEKIAGGDLESRVPVRSRDEFGQLATAFNDMARDLDRNQKRLLDEERRRRDQEIEQLQLKAEYQRKTRELEEAREFQLSLLPKELPSHPSFEVAVHMQTATEVGGDYYDFHLGEDGTLTVAVGDATGHGARAGTMVTVVKSLFSAYASGSGLRRFLIGANHTIRRMALGRMAMTLVLAEIRRGALTLASAGMPPALIHRPGSGTVDEVVLEGMPLGGLEFEYRERRVELTPGDTLLLMTDGLPELVGSGGEVLGYDRTHELFARAASKPPREVVAELAAAVSAWTGSDRPGDDVTFVVIRVRPAESS
ncbi:MAG: SpoIIE family protein phosphatase [Thermoanaerobaculia bacterium]